MPTPKPLIALDLDDTLYHEIDFVKSAYAVIADELDISGFIEKDVARKIMDESPTMREAIDNVRRAIGWGAPEPQWFVGQYRFHYPDIHLDEAVERQLQKWVDEDYPLAIVTDGPFRMQQNKIDALGLERFVEPGLTIISGEIGADKTTSTPFDMLYFRFFAKVPRAYIGDNPAKDFRWPNKLGWYTAMLKGDSRNLKSQDFSELPQEYHPKQIITSLSEFHPEEMKDIAL